MIRRPAPETLNEPKELKSMAPTLTSEAQPPIEYAVYTFDLPADGKTQSRWNRHATTGDMNRALSEARHLLDTRRFTKVEVKKKFYDLKSSRYVDITLKTFTLSPTGATAAQTVIIAALMAALAFLAAYTTLFQG
jgi:hypothetical protein